MKTAQTITDQTLIKAYLNGDEKSFEILLGRNKDRVFGYIISKIKNYDLANDIFQDVFIKVIKNLKKGAYNEEGKFLPWVLTIAHNLVIDHFRRNKKMPTISETSYGNEDFDIFSVLKLTDKNVEDLMIKSQVEEKLTQLIEFLPADQKDVLKKRIYVGMSFKDIAEKEDISINTALGRMRYALINLRKLIEEHEVCLAY
ncbi:RNA polymerase subunit sigma-24 [Putridiphycobacter roseus]|uniref:RNA polymerase subunit sigma-24 n=1 Tax=Putridiphycobacter roseus TaxID=2219161 RepID=A0A2W1N134_9FLAO|nr:sigma-70 family RNA polymerase sigma factor [Putridiphycobacter roseus]PZE17494.1 RNA polymerase subunit sigma-24 [Putridiphycobacter roseus]